MNKWINHSATFLILSLMFCIGLGICIGVCDKVDMHLWLNGTHTAAGDFFFRYYTLVGEWVPYVIVVLLLFYKAGWASFLLADVALSGLIGQGLKHIFNTPRPYTYFAQHAPEVQLQFVDGVPLNRLYSFPSGHTTTFFALFMTLTVILCEIFRKNTCEQYPQNTCENRLLNTCFSRRSPEGHPKVTRRQTESQTLVNSRSIEGASHCLLSVNCRLFSVICFLLAVLGGYSRIYLNQHFAEDIFGGVIIGVLTTLGLLLAVPKLENTPFWDWNLLHIKPKTAEKEKKEVQ